MTQRLSQPTEEVTTAITRLHSVTEDLPTTLSVSQLSTTASIFTSRVDALFEALGADNSTPATSSSASTTPTTHPGHHPVPAVRALRCRDGPTATSTQSKDYLRNQIRNARQRRARHQEADSITSLLLQAARDSNFWRKWKRRFRADPKVAEADFLAYYQTIFGRDHQAASTTVPDNIPSGNVALNPNINPLHDLLHSSFTSAELLAATASLNQKKSVAGAFLTSSFKQVIHLIAEPLTTLLNHCVKTGYIPDIWAWGYITPIFKPGGNAFTPSDYRPITVGTLLAKIYAACLNNRLTTWSEATGIRATGQAGFRADFRTADHAFTLRTIIEVQRFAKQGLYCCFVDFKKAYDCIPRDKLWTKLKTHGVCGWLLRAI